MQIRDLYDQYNLMPQLREHQLRVGGIVRLISRDKVAIKTALVHDMGNIAKFTGLNEYWSNEQRKIWNKYGREAHQVTYAILRDAGLNELEQRVREEGDFYKKIIELDGKYDNYSDAAVYTLYADCRVAMNGIVSVEARVRDLEKRYGSMRNDRLWVSKLEDYVAKRTGVEVAKISNQDVEPLFDELLSYNV